MPFTDVVDHDLRLVRITLTGAFTVAEMTAYVELAFIRYGMIRTSRG
jgi:hypothetical protein